MAFFFTDLTQKIGIFDRFYAKKWLFFTDLTRKIGVFGVNFILQKFCPCKKMTNIRYGHGVAIDIETHSKELKIDIEAQT